jgi:hypothetical protein
MEPRKPVYGTPYLHEQSECLFLGPNRNRAQPSDLRVVSPLFTFGPLCTPHSANAAVHHTFCPPSPLRPQHT